ncbi:MAG: DUF898 domain-containing protein [Gammaproteobacteria bacterium]|nr:MAG: DUF898 domain-containing protein [Gammaproteobacteria bacterium]
MPSLSPRPLQFHGKAMEFFRIWAVNLVLTLLTLGIYSAWAKVRTQKYLYRNLELDGHRFDYTAEPMQILKGRLVAVALFGALSVMQNLSQDLAAWATLAFMLLMPAIIVMSLSFRLRNTRYRGVAFGFERDFKSAYMIFGLPILLAALYLAVLVFLGPQSVAERGETQVDPSQVMIFGLSVLVIMLLVALGAPGWDWWLRKFISEHARFGTTPFDFNARLRDYYGLYGKVSLIAILLFAGLFLFLNGAGRLSADMSDPQAFMKKMAILTALPGLLAWGWAWARLNTGRINLSLNGLSLNGHQVRSRVTTGMMMWLYLSNTAAILLSLGLLIPWAKIRVLRYRASVTGLLAHSPLDQFVAEQEEQVNALGEEMGDVFDVEVGL